MGRLLHRYNIETKQLTSFEITCDSINSLISDYSSPQIVFDNIGGIWIYFWVNYEYHIFKGTFLKDSTLMIHQLGLIPIPCSPSTSSIP